MSPDVIAFVHILLFVFWLGADVGVFVLAQMVKRRGLSFETRATLMEGLVLIDLLPRLSWALMLPVGLQLATSLGLVQPGPLLPVAWVVGIGWATLILVAARDHESAFAQLWGKIQLALVATIGSVLVATALWSLLGDGPVDTPWLATKVLFYGLIFFVGIGLELSFLPVMTVFPKLAEGPNEAHEAALARGINVTSVWVGLLYSLVALAAFWGTVKPSILN